MSKFSKRCYKKELMDDLHCSGKELEQTLRELRTINRLLGGNKVTTSGIRTLVGKKNRRPYSVADLGCGGGDMTLVMKDWSIRNGYRLRIIGIDANPNIISLAKEKVQLNYPEIEFRQGNVFDTDYLTEEVDIQTCTLFMHHFTDDELVQILINLKGNTKIGMVINDLHRHFLAYHSIKWLTTAFSRSQMVKNDAPLSVLRAFSREDWKRLLRAAGIEKYKISWHWAFRWQVICWV
ncbi:methyltransferase domain-containing protein [Cyclobacterium jeungdonense]|uniref:Methyltransferase domain-containing protein n=1 Tax=Cyclobacterium jeungdonense TaxID=708087 RepID=A0ABT8CAP6_9BACT|nr:methyltransferase domain-containing protein [Cyclobacterium jeungdonense]MDN3689585.1 methyltransferase domain-containing protein [Cyclobacterium jeungdonense]